jgi:hypothetical protein
MSPQVRKIAQNFTVFGVSVLAIGIVAGFIVALLTTPGCASPARNRVDGGTAIMSRSIGESVEMEFSAKRPKPEPAPSGVWELEVTYPDGKKEIRR